MLRRRDRCWAATAGLLLGLALAAAAQAPADADPRPPRIFPDYSGVVIPPNLAPMNFVVEESGDRCRATFRGAQGRPFEVKSSDRRVRIPESAWRELLAANAGQPLCVDVSVRETNGVWKRFATITNTVAREPVDDYLTYRLLRPLYNLYTDLGIYQRNLRNFDEREILHSRAFDNGCLNCHTFCNRQPDPMALHVRTEKHGLPMLLARNGEVTTVNRPMGYLAWHPNERLLVFSMNRLSIFFHTLGENRDVFDAESNLGLYRLDANTFSTPMPIARKDFRETWPAWSPDGRFLYFCRAPQLPIEQYRKIKYDLLRVSYDSDRDAWGEPEVLVSAQQTQLSAGQPKVSPDGRWLLFCLATYGNFPVYQPSSDLYLMDLGTREFRRLECNSDQADSWHSWSGNSRWIVFSSKRRDGLFARPHFSYLDADGHASKPVLLPQKDPAFYDSFLKTFNVPEFVAGPIRVPERAWAEAILHPRRKVTPQMATSGTASAPGETNAPPTAHESQQ